MPNAKGFPEGTLLMQVGGTNIFIRRCDVCFAALIDTHDADAQEHMEWHERTGTNSPPAS